MPQTETEVKARLPGDVGQDGDFEGDFIICTRQVVLSHFAGHFKETLCRVEGFNLVILAENVCFREHMHEAFPTWQNVEAEFKLLLILDLVDF